MIVNINELQTHTSTWMYLSNMLSEIIMSQKNTQYDFIYINSNYKKTKLSAYDGYMKEKIAKKNKKSRRF